MFLISGLVGLFKRSSVTTFQNAVRIDDAPTSDNSSSLDVSSYKRGVFYIYIDSTGSGGHTLKVIPQFSDDNTNWFDAKGGAIGNIEYEDVDSASGLRECFALPFLGKYFRVRVVGTGTTATLYFDITTKGEFYR